MFHEPNLNSEPPDPQAASHRVLLQVRWGPGTGLTERDSLAALPLEFYSVWPLVGETAPLGRTPCEATCYLWGWEVPKA